MILNETINVWYQIVAFVSLVCIFAFCVWCVFSQAVNDGLIGRCLYSVAAISASAGLMHMLMGTYPHRTLITLLATISLMMARYVVLKSGTWSAVRRYYFKHHLGKHHANK